MKKIIDWIIDQQLESVDLYQRLVLPLSEEFNIRICCAQSIVDGVVEWELDPNTIDSLEVLLNKRFPDIVIK
jgi:hypothetical protein